MVCSTDIIMFRYRSESTNILWAHAPYCVYEPIPSSIIEDGATVLLQTRHTEFACGPYIFPYCRNDVSSGVKGLLTDPAKLLLLD